MKLLLAPLGPLGILAAGIVTTATAVPQLDPANSTLAIIIGVGTSVLGAAVPLTIKLTRLERLVRETVGHDRTLYGEKDNPQDGLVYKIAANAADLEDMRRGLVEAEAERDDIKRQLIAIELVYREQGRRLDGAG